MNEGEKAEKREEGWFGSVHVGESNDTLAWTYQQKKKPKLLFVGRN